MTLSGIVTLVRPMHSENASVPDAGDVGANRDIGQTGTIIERLVSDVGNAVGNHVAACFAHRICDEHGLALVEQDSSHAAINRIGCIHRDCLQADAFIERPIPDAGNAVGDRDVGQAGAAIERPVPNADDAVRRS